MQRRPAIAYSTRRRIVELLAERDRSTGELVAECNVSVAAIPNSLNLLREVCVISTEPESQAWSQSLNVDGLDAPRDWLENTQSIWSRRMDAFEQELRAEPERAR